MRIAPCCVDGLGWPQGVLSHSPARTRRKHGRPMDGLADGSVVGRVICGLAARPLPARRCGTRRKHGRPMDGLADGSVVGRGDLRPGCRALARPPLRDTPQGGAADGRPCRWTSWRAGRSAAWLQALARPPSRDTPQVRPCRLWRGIHAAQGPATVGGQGPVKRVDVRGCERDMTCVGRIRGHPISFQAHAEQQPDFSRATQDFPAS
ncbi:hypothetical protein FHY16_001400 [Xanthomonas campestris]|nr:hypothetical protein [Xanthomonas euroxanthea]